MPSALSLIDHSADVGACFAALLGFNPVDGALYDSVLRARIARLAGLREISTVHLARLTVLAVLHDLGKANHGFQRKRFGRDAKGTAGHVAEALGLIKEHPPELRD